MLHSNHRWKYFFFSRHKLKICTHYGGRGSKPGQCVQDLWMTKWHWDRVFLWVLWFPVRIIPPVCHNHLYLNTAVTRRKDTWSLETLKQSSCVLDIVQQSTEKHFHITVFKVLCCNITWSLLCTFNLKSIL